ncbi:MAG: alpha/beta hydrolase [Bacteroidota bacterium]
MKRIRLQIATISLFLLVCMLHPVPLQAQANKVEGIIQADQFRLRYSVEGEGQPALVIGSATYYARAFSQNLRKHLKLVFLDHRGFAAFDGKVDTTDFTLEKIVTDMERARQQLQLGKIVVIGHSGHSYMALEYAKTYPEQVTHVVMIGIAPNLSLEGEKLIEQTWHESVDPERKKVMEDNLRRLTDAELAELSPGEAFNQAYVRSGPRAWYDPHFDASYLWEGVELNMDMFNYMWGGVFRRIDITQGLADFHKPVFLALGRYDYLVPPAYTWEPLRPHFKDLSMRIFEKSGHTPQLEQPELFDQELLQWLAR